jgi:hypothetical protein
MTATLTLSDHWCLRAPGRAEHSFAAEPGGALPAALCEALASLPPRSALSVQLAGAAARWLLLPHSPRLVSERAWEPFARAWFEQQHAQAAAAWTLRWWVEAPGHPRLMAALPTALIDALRGAAQRLALSVHLQTIDRLAALRVRQPRFTGAFCDLDAAHALLVLCREGRPVRVRKRAGALDAPGLLAMLKTEWAAAAPLFGPRDARCSHLALAPAAALSDADRLRLRDEGVLHITDASDGSAAR